MANETSAVKLLELTDSLLESIDERSRDILRRRFAIKSAEVETLESIGREYGITRERVRQIESQAKKGISQLKETLQPAADIFQTLFQEHGGLLADEHVVQLAREYFGELSAAHVYLYLEILPGYKHVSVSPHFNPHWQHSAINTESATAAVQAATEILEQAKHPLKQETLFTQIAQQADGLVAKKIEACLIASKKIDRTPFREWGLTSWSETTPRGVGDKAYAVLRRNASPEHFTKITELINEAHFDHKRANPQTVHNELIKDKRFVLVGRGLYGLAEWGYIPGTVADVLESLLRKSQEPLTRDELIEQVLAQRQVKKNTILLGLQNEKRFLKTPENRYTLRQK